MKLALVAVVTLGACGQPLAAPAPAPKPVAVVPADAAGPTQEERLAAIQKAMNDLSGAAQQCWAKIAAERFDIEGELEASIDIGTPTQVAIGKDTTHSPKLAACMHDVLVAYPWAPPLRGQAIRLPFKWRAPDGQSVIDRRLVPWTTQNKVGVAVLLDENNTGNDMISLFELAIDGTTGYRFADRPELWYFLGEGEIRTGHPSRAVGSGDMMFVGKDGAREIAGTLHAIVAMVPGGREGAARAGALPTGVAGEKTKQRPEPQILLAQDAKTYGPVTIFAEDATIHDKRIAGSVLHLAAGAAVPEHVHATETEVLYVLAGSGTITVAGVAIAVTPTSVIQIPKNTKHAFTAATDFRAVQFYTPGGPEQRFKK